MTDTTIGAEASTTSDPGLFSRVVGIFLSPRDTYSAVAARPRVLGVLAVSILVIAIAQGWFLSSDVGKEALLDQQVTAMESFGVNVTDEMYATLEGRLPYAPYFAVGQTVVFMPIVLAIMGGLCLMVFNAFLGGDASFKQVYAILAHSTVIGALQQLFNLPVNYARGEMSSPTLMSVFFPMLDEMSFATYFLSAIDLFIIWSVVSISIGLAALYKRRTGPIAASFLGIYAVIALIIAFVRAF